MLLVSGAWTPGITVGGTTTGITYSIQNGRYTRIGNLIFISGVMIINFTARAGSVVLTGLPFTTSSNAVEAWAIGAAGVGTAAGKAFFLNINPDATTANFVYSQNFSAESPIDGSNLIGPNPTFYVNGVYSSGIEKNLHEAPDSYLKPLYRKNSNLDDILRY